MQHLCPRTSIIITFFWCVKMRKNHSLERHKLRNYYVIINICCCHSFILDDDDNDKENQRSLKKKARSDVVEKKVHLFLLISRYLGHKILLKFHFSHISGGKFIFLMSRQHIAACCCWASIKLFFSPSLSSLLLFFSLSFRETLSSHNNCCFNE